MSIWTNSSLVVFITLLGTGCATAPVTPAEFDVSPPLLPVSLDTRMAAISNSMEPQGFIKTSSSQGEISHDKPIQHSVVFKTGRRVVAAVIGSDPSFNLNMVILDAEKSIVVQDSSSDIRAVVEWIANKGESYDIQISSSEGTAKYSLSVFSAAADTPSIPIRGFFDSDIKKTFSNWTDVAKHLEALDFQQHGRIVKLMVDRRDRHTFPVQLVSGRCYSFVTAGSHGIDKLDLRLEQDSKLLIADLSQRPTAVFRYCAEKAIEAKIVLKVLAGSGTVTYGVFAAWREDVLDLVGPPLRLRPFELPSMKNDDDELSGPSQLSHTLNLPDYISAHSVNLSAKQFAKNGLSGKNALSPFENEKNGNNLSASLNFEADRCFGIAVFSKDLLERVELRDSSGEVLGKWLGPGIVATMGKCFAAETKVEIRAVYRGSKNANHSASVLIFHSDIPFGRYQ